jgi:hypothetical protein
MPCRTKLQRTKQWTLGGQVERGERGFGGGGRRVGVQFALYSKIDATTDWGLQFGNLLAFWSGFELLLQLEGGMHFDFLEWLPFNSKTQPLILLSTTVLGCCTGVQLGQLHQLGPDWTNSTHQCTMQDGWFWTGNTFSLYYLCPIGNQPQWSAIC